MAEYRAPGRCPVCGETFRIARVKCDSCGSELSGDFAPCKFCSLDAQNYRFLESFLRCRGNIREVERDLGISYPTVRNSLDALLTALGYAKPEEQGKESAKKDILDRLARKELSSADALAMLEELDNETEGEG